MPITRRFADLTDEEIEKIETGSILRGRGRYGTTDWDGLLKSRRILIVSEAGVGKTYECQRCRDRLWAAGEPAFLLELATLADDDVLDILSSEEHKRFESWKAAQSGDATFFLDSIDELKISQKSFKQALKRLNRAIAGNLARTRIVITTRPIVIDRQTIAAELEIPARAITEPTAEAFADIATRRKSSNQTSSDEPPNWRNVGLLPLARDQIADFASEQGVHDTDALLSDIDQRDGWDYTERPMDLIELCSDWKEHHRIRNHGEQAEANATNKLKPRTDRPEKAALTTERALEGASRIALAALLTRKLTIRYSAESDHLHTADAALDASKVLLNWSQPECDTLLERALFGFANYGRVRFHHRSVIEYLAARRLDTKMKSGVPIVAIKRVLFAETAQGLNVVRPSMRPVAAWLSLWHTTIFSEVKAREPEVLLSEGDPQSLSPAQRADVLTEYVTRYGSGGWRGHQIPDIQVRRFASIELGSTVRRLWWNGVENPEVRELLFELIGAGKMSDCADFVYDVAVNSSSTISERLSALDALIALQDKRIDGIGRSLVTDNALWPSEIARRATLRLFPRHLDVKQFCGILPRIREAPRAIGDLTWTLPRLIAEEKFSTAALGELREGLTQAVTYGAKWEANKWPHATTRRPDLLPGLVATCNRQFRDGAITEALVKSAMAALRFSKEETANDSAEASLRAYLSEAPSSFREKAFWADDALLEALNKMTDAWHRVFWISHHGGIRLSPDKDREWVFRRLSDPSGTELQREMMLYAAMIDLARQGDDPLKHLEELKVHVADSPALLSIINARMKPPEGSEQLRKMQEENAKREEQRKQKDAEARSSWIKFWREIAESPDQVFDASRADNTAWNLWQAMERAGPESRASGWSRRFIEEQFGKETADRLRTTLMRMWRTDKPTLRNERPPEEKNRIFVKWQLGLAAIYAESEDPQWAAKLTEDEAKLAARYAPMELSRYPAWLEQLAAAHPSAVDDTLGRELSEALSELSGDSSASISLQNVRNAGPSVAALFVPRVKKWLDDLRDKGFSNAANEDLINQAIDLLLMFGNPALRNELASAASDEVAKGLNTPFVRVWLPLLMRLRPAEGVAALESGLKDKTVSTRGLGVQWVGRLFGRHRHNSTVDLQRPEFTPTLLLRLLRLTYQHVRITDDQKHEGSYSPDDRDDAEEGRNWILSTLLSLHGQEAWDTKLEMSNDPLFAHFKDRIILLARERAAEEVDGSALTEAQFVQFDRRGEVPTTTRDGLFEVMRDRLADIDDLLLQDISPRGTWALIKDEYLMRREIARELESKANGVYRVDQEAATADEKETDIRLRATASAHQAVIEVKIGDKPRSGKELRDTIKAQLVTKYMAPQSMGAGCLLITLSSDKTWIDPETGDTLDFPNLVHMLNVEAKKVSLELGGSVRLLVKGYDLRPRLKPEREAKVRKS